MIQSFKHTLIMKNLHTKSSRRVFLLTLLFLLLLNPLIFSKLLWLQELYVSSTKREKMSISRSIVQAVRSLDPPGRFLDKDPVSGLWHDIGHKKAVEKTSQALRDGAAMLRKQLSADLGDPDFLSAVFSDDASSKDEERKKMGSGKVSIKQNGKENKESKGSSPAKAKAIKVCIDRYRLYKIIHYPKQCLLRVLICILFS